LDAFAAGLLRADGLGVEADEDVEGAEVDVWIGSFFEGLGLEQGGGGGLGGLRVGCGEFDEPSEGRWGEPLFVIGGEGTDVGFQGETDWWWGGGELDDFAIWIGVEPRVELGSGWLFKIRKPVVAPYFHRRSIVNSGCLVNIFVFY
jgi:hypothetical protein